MHHQPSLVPTDIQVIIQTAELTFQRRTLLTEISTWRRSTSASIKKYANKLCLP